MRVFFILHLNHLELLILELAQQSEVLLDLVLKIIQFLDFRFEGTNLRKYPNLVEQPSIHSRGKSYNTRSSS